MITRERALEALDSLDDYAKMGAGVDAHGPIGVLKRFIEQGSPYKGLLSEDIVFLLRKRAEIRRSITTRKSVQENAPDRISDLLEQAADEIIRLRTLLEDDWK